MVTVNPIPAIDGAFVVEPDVHTDARGFFVETYRRSWFPNQREMIQSNRADRVAGTVVGLHYHLHQSDYWYVPAGRLRVVLHDLREGSETDGQTWITDLGLQADGCHRHSGVYIPPGVAHGFSTLADSTLSYLVDGYYNPADELGVAWDDPAIGADWGIEAPALSERDRRNPNRIDLPSNRRPHHSLRGR